MAGTRENRPWGQTGLGLWPREWQGLWEGGREGGELSLGEGREASCPWDGDPEEEQTRGDVEASVSHSKEPKEHSRL